MKNEMEVKRCFVIVDFAMLTPKQHEKVIKKMRVFYPKDVILPNSEKDVKYDTEKYIYKYFVCTIERELFDRSKVQVIYTGISSKKTKQLLAFDLKKA